MSSFIIPDNFLTQDDHRQVDNVVWPIKLTDCKTFDSLDVNLPAAAANDDMGLVTGTPGTNALTLQGVDFGGTTSDEKCGFIYPLPIEYVAGQSVTLRAHAGMLTTISDGATTLDCSAWADDGDGTVSSDLCATAATSIKSLTLADIDFTITPTTLTPGMLLFVQLSFAGTDSGNLGVMIATITKLSMLLDCRG